MGKEAYELLATILSKKPSAEIQRFCRRCGRLNRTGFKTCQPCRKTRCEERNAHNNPVLGFRFHADNYLAIVCSACGTIVVPRKRTKGAHNGGSDWNNRWLPKKKPVEE